MSATSLNISDAALPWSPRGDEDKRFWRIAAVALGLCLLLGVIVPFLPVAEIERAAAPELPPRIAKLVVERKPPPPPPPVVEQPKPETPKPEAKPETIPRPVPKATPTDPQAAKDRAARAGVLAFRDSLADLRRDERLGSLKQDDQRTAGGEARQRERAIITSKLDTGSGGINTASLSRDTGGGGGQGLGSRTTAQVASPVADAQVKARAGSGKKASRTDEEIQLVFDRNKSGIYALYHRALRSNPALQGKVVLRLTIAPSGEVTEVSVVSSELNEADLERKLMLRVKQFDFGRKDAGSVTITYPIAFFPS